MDNVIDTSMIGICSELSPKFVESAKFYPLFDSKLAVISEIHGKDLASLVLENIIPINEAFIRSMLRSLLQAVFYCSTQLNGDFRILITDITVSVACGEFTFRLKNNFVQKSADPSPSILEYTNPAPCRRRSKSDAVGPIPELAIRSLGLLAYQLLQDRFGFLSTSRDSPLKNVSASLANTIISMITYEKKVNKNPEKLLKSFSELAELKTDWGRKAIGALVGKVIPVPSRRTGKRNSSHI